jgi:hypothetical protein
VGQGGREGRKKEKADGREQEVGEGLGEFERDHLSPPAPPSRSWTPTHSPTTPLCLFVSPPHLPLSLALSLRRDGEGERAKEERKGFRV